MDERQKAFVNGPPRSFPSIIAECLFRADVMDERQALIFWKEMGAMAHENTAWQNRNPTKDGGRWLR